MISTVEYLNMFIYLVYYITMNYATTVRGFGNLMDYTKYGDSDTL